MDKEKSEEVIKTQIKGKRKKYGKKAKYKETEIEC